MKASMQLTIHNQLNLTPQLQQAINLLKLSTLDLRQEIQNQLESNPLLETQSNPELETMEDEFEVYEQDEDFQWSSLYTAPSQGNMFNENGAIIEKFHCTKISLREHLIWQLDLMNLSDIDRIIAITLVDAIDDNGFLTQSCEEIKNSLSSEKEPIEYSEVEAVLHLIQHIDPIGCGARNLAETLLIQLDECKAKQEIIDLTRHIISENIELLAKHQYSTIKKKYNIENAKLEGVIQLIHHLHPYPGSLIAEESPEYIIPDILVSKSQGRWQASLNPEVLPKLGINLEYASMLKTADNSSDRAFLQSNLREAKWFLKGLQSRQDTVLKVAQYIVAYQQDFFERGEQAMKPLTLNQVAGELGMHESTISRVTTQKFLYSAKGTFELKFFFSSHISNHNGEHISSTAIRARLKELITTEDAKKPLSDNKIVSILHKEGVQISRRTIAKYREELGILPSFERKHP